MSLTLDRIHISSLIIHCFPEKLNAVMQKTQCLKNVEVAAHDIKGKLVVVLETESEKGIMSIIDQIQMFDGVLTATMVYHETDC